MEMLTVFNAKINVMHVRHNLIFAYLVMERIELLGLQLIMIASKYNLIKYLDAFKVISIMICLIVLFANVNALPVYPLLLIAFPVKVQIELYGVQLIIFVCKLDIFIILIKM